MESLANYSALLYLEKRSGRHTINLMLEEYKTRLLSKTPANQILESTGPIVLGPRLETAQSPFAWQFITYGKRLVDSAHAAFPLATSASWPC
jgi:hypothetical protein